MRTDFFRSAPSSPPRRRGDSAFGACLAEPRHGIAMYGDPPTPRFCASALRQPGRADRRPDRDRRSGSFDSLNPAHPQGLVAVAAAVASWRQTLMGRSWMNRSRFTGCWPNRSRSAESGMGRIHPAPRGPILRRQPRHGRGCDVVLRDPRHRGPSALSRDCGPRSSMEQTGDRSCASPSTSRIASWRCWPACARS